MDEILKNIYSKYPALSEHPFKVMDSRNIGLLNPRNTGGGSLEFYSPDERHNPNPGYPTVEVFDPSLKNEWLERAVFGDMLHYLPSVDDTFSDLRKDFAGTITDEQKQIDQNAYSRAQQRHGEARPYNDWFERSRLDAYLRGYLAPDERNEWSGSYTPEQLSILKEIESLISQPTSGLLQ